MKNKKLTFTEIKKIIIEKCKEKSACEPEFKKLLASKTEKDFWDVIKNNAYWAHTEGVISVKLFEKYDIKKLNDNFIFIDGKTRDLEKDKICILYNGTVSKNYGTVSYNGNNGTVSKNYGTVSENNGTVSENNGTVSENNGTVSKNYGTVSENYGTVSYNGNYGTVSENYGTVSYNGNNGTVSKNYGTVSENYGTVSENYGTVSENYGTGIIIERQNKKIYIKKNEFEIIYL